MVQPESDDQETTERCSATLRLFGRIVDAEVIGMRLGLEPSRIRRAGDAAGEAEGRYDLDFWELTAPVAADRPLEDHLAWLRSRLVPRGTVLIDLLTALSGDVYCEYRIPHGRGGLDLSMEAMKWLVDLGLGLSVAVTADPPGRPGRS